MTAPGMGRGLAAILPSSSDRDAPELRRVPVELIRPNPAQPRKRFDPASIAALAASMADAGVVQPLIVRPLADGRYELIAGERRWRAAREARLATVPVLVRDEDEARRLQTALIENVAREDLNPVDEARACAALVDDLGISKEELARRIGRSRSAISNLVRLLDLPDEALALLESGELSEGHGRALLRAGGGERRVELARRAAAEGWSVRETERAAAEGGPGRQARRGGDADRDAALAAAEEALEAALGRGVRLRPRRSGIDAELHFADLDELREFATGLPRMGRPGD